MKNFLILCLLFFIELPAFSADKLVKPTAWESFVLPEYNYSYMEPIERTKEEKRKDWLICLGTAFLYPKPILIFFVNQVIAANNKLYEQYAPFRIAYENDINNCEILSKNNEKLQKCYNDVRQLHFNKMVKLKKIEQTEELLKLYEKSIYLNGSSRELRELRELRKAIESNSN